MQYTTTRFYTAKGMVYGKYWGGGEGAYPSTPLRADTKVDLIKQANELLASGGLDGGMGYESLIGAVLDVTEHEILTDEHGKQYESIESELETIGTMDDVQEDFTIEAVLG